jgi:hypothetical protein
MSRPWRPDFSCVHASGELAETRVVLDVAPNRGGWYKVVAAIRVTKKVQAITG